jgi:Bacterial SH3 domain
MLRLIVLVSVLFVASALAAAPVRLTEEAIRQTLVGSLLEIDTPLGIAVPVRISADGLVSGEAGPLASTLGAVHDRGRWWIDHDQLCVKWFRWFEAQTRCLTLQREGAKIYWQDAEGKSGTATITTAQGPAIASTPTIDTRQRPPVTEAAAPASSVETAPAQSAEEWEAPRFAAVELRMSEAPPALPQETKLTNPEVSIPNTRASNRIATAAIPPAKGPTARRPAAIGASYWRPSFRVARVSMDDALVMRSGPSEYHAAVGTIPADGYGVEIIGECHDLWCPVRHHRTFGWVNRYYLAEEITPLAADEERQ